MNLLQIDGWKKRFLTPAEKIVSNVKISTVQNYVLPLNAVLHFQPDSEQIIGVDNSFSLIRFLPNVLMYSVTEVDAVVGTFNKLNYDYHGALKKYYKSHLTVKPILNLEKVLGNTKEPILINYGLLPKLLKYATNSLTLYYEWYNNRNTIYSKIKEIGPSKQHFLCYKIPETLPSKTELLKYAESFKPAGMGIFYDNDCLNLLELWRLVSPNVESFITSMDEKLLETINLVFIEKEQLITVNLGDLSEWCNEEDNNGLIAFYHFLDNIISLRSKVGKIEEVEETDVSEDSTIVRLIKENAAAGNLSGSEQRSLLNLSNKYKTIKDPKGSGKSLDQLVVTKEDLAINNGTQLSNTTAIKDLSMLKNILKTFDSDYVEFVMHKDIIGMILSLQNGGFIIKDIKVVAKKTAVTKSESYIVSLQPIDGPASTFPLTVPIIGTDGTFFASNVKYRMDKQRGELPVVKNKKDSVILTSYYGKLFITRNDSSSHNYSKWITKQILNSNADEDGVVSNLKYGGSVYKEKALPRQYTAIGETFDSFVLNIKDSLTPILDGQWQYNFNYSKVDDLFTSTKQHKELLEEILKRDFVPVAFDTNKAIPRFLVMDYIGTIFLYYANDIRSPEAGSKTNIGPFATLIDPDVSLSQAEFSELGLLNRRIPLILAFSYLYGLDKALKKLDLPYKLIPNGIRTPFNVNEYKIKFKDVTYLVTVKKPKDKLLISGFNAIKNESPKYRGSDFNKPSIYGSLLAKLGIGAVHLRELQLIMDMFIEPITADLLKDYDQPTDIYNLLLSANELLINDYIPDVQTDRLKGYERIAGIIYSQLISAVRIYRSQGSVHNKGLSINPKAVWLDIIQDETIALIEESNPLHNDKEKSAFTYSGHGGRSTVTMVKDTRGFSKHDLGFVSEATPDSGKVGVRAYLSSNPNFTSLRGTTSVFNPETDGPANAVSTTALLSTGVTHDGPARVNFINIHWSAAVSATGYEPVPYRTGAEETLGIRVDDLFVVNAEQNGKVLEVTDEIITVQYDDKSTKVYELGVSHGTVAGVTIPHSRVTDLPVGYKFSKGDAIVFNEGFFQRAELNKNNVVLKPGILAKVAFLENSETSEDGSSISLELARKLETPTTKVYGIIVDFNQSIGNLVKVGEEVNPDTILCTIQETIELDEDRNNEALLAIQSLGANNPKAKTYGKITKMEALYYGKIDDMSPSLQKVANKFDNDRAKRINKLELDDAKTGRIDESIRINGKKLLEGQLGLKIYIDNYLSMESGDKIEFGHMMKSTCSTVITDKILTENGVEIDAFFGALSASARIVGSPFYGVVNYILVEGTKRFKEIYNS